MTIVLTKVRALIERLAPEPVCDDCITERLGLDLRDYSNHETRELAGTDGFELRLDPCALCGTTKTVIRKGR
jgi:hypothetical protein